MSLSPKISQMCSPGTREPGTSPISGASESTPELAADASQLSSVAASPTASGSSNAAADNVEASLKGSPKAILRTPSYGSPKVSTASWKQRMPLLGISGAPRSLSEDTGSGVEKREAAGAPTRSRARGQPSQGEARNSPRTGAAASPAGTAATAATTSPAAAEEASVPVANAASSDVRQDEAVAPQATASGVNAAGENPRQGEQEPDPFELPREAESKDDDVVELLPTLHASSQASLLRHNEVNVQASRSVSRTSKLTAGDLASLRTQAVEAATGAITQAGSPRMPGGSYAAISGPVKAPATSAEEGGASASALRQVPQGSTEAAAAANGGHELEGAHQRVMQQWANQPTPLKVPSEDSSDPIPEMHSSSNTLLQPAMVPSMLFRQYQPTDQVAQRNGVQRVGNQPVRRENSGASGPLRESLRTHGAGTAPTTVGFLEAGPFWTCGSTPHCRAASRRATSNTSAAQSMLGDVFRRSSSAADLSSHISSVLCNCINLISKAVDVPPEPEPPEDELTTVFLETKEQRLQWRDFLSEAVSKCKANTLFQAYDVEADPPRYMRPPPSMAPKIDSAVRSFQQAGMQTPPHIVAPRGAGWSPIPPKETPVGESCATQGSGASASSSSPANGSFAFATRPNMGFQIDPIGGDSDLPASVAPTPGCTPAPTRPGEDAATNSGAAAEAMAAVSEKLSANLPQRLDSSHLTGEAVGPTVSGSQRSSSSRQTEGTQQSRQSRSKVSEATTSVVSGTENSSMKVSSNPTSPSATSRSPMSMFKLPSKGAVVSSLGGRRPPPAG